MKFPAFLQTLLTDYFRWVAAVLVAAVLALGYFFVLDQKIANLRSSGILKRANVEAELATQKEYLSKLQDSIDSFHTAVPNELLSKVNSFMPTGSDFPGLLLTLEQLAVSANLQLDSISINEVGQTIASSGSTEGSDTAVGTPALAATAGGLNLRTQDVTVSVSGGTNYESFKQFVTLLETSQRLLDVISLGFSFPDTTAAGTTQSPYNVVVRTYYLPESQ